MKHRPETPAFVLVHPYQPAPLWVWIAAIVLTGVAGIVVLALKFAG